MQITAAINRLISQWYRASLKACAALLVACSVWAQEGYVVTDVSFRGNQTLSDAQIVEQIAMHGRAGFLGLFSDREDFIFSRDALEADIERLTRYYQRQGFLRVRVGQPELNVNHSKQHVKVSLVIEEGRPVAVDSVLFDIIGSAQAASDGQETAEVDSLLQEVSTKLMLSPGVRFRDRLVEQDRRTLADYLSEHGYPHARSNPDLQVDTVAMAVRLIWRVNPGPVSSFGEVTVTGNKNVPTAVILRQLAFSEGERYRHSLLSRTQEWIYGLGAFRVATVSASLDSAANREVPIRIRVDEAPRLTSEFGVGYGREEEFRAYNRSRFIGFLGKMRRLETMVRHSALEPYHVAVSWIHPAFVTPHTRLAVSPFARRQTEPGFTVNRLGGDIEIRHQFSRHLDASVKYIFEQVDLDEGSVAADELLSEDLERLYNKSSIVFGIARHDSEPLFSPKRGSRLAATTKFSGLDLGSSYHFASVLVEGRYYRSVAGMVVASRLKSGVIESFDPSGFVPIEDRFFSGGSQSVRGWGRSRLGPISGDKPVGGLALLELSIELRYPLLWKISGAVFMDAGNVWRDVQNTSLDDLRYAAGLGLRYTTPIGPVRLDAARPVWDDQSLWQFHLSVGEAF
jgi:outer membrane protein insertion porin family